MLAGKRCLACLIALCGATAVASEAWLDWLNSQVLDRVRVSGQRTFAFRSHHVEGNREAFNQLNYFGEGDRQFSQVGDVTISGDKVLGVLSFDVRLSTYKYANPDSQRIALTFERDWGKVTLGDINASVGGGNELVSLRRFAQGAQADVKFGNLRVTGVATRSKTSARTISFNGNNSAGPYYLNGSRIVDGTLRVRVDGVDQVLGTDYVANYEIGTITFLNRVIPPTSVITVTYESRGLNNARGAIVGGSVVWTPMSGLDIGFTRVEQKAVGSTGLSQTTEEFEGFGPPDVPYYLLQPPLRDRPILVTVDNVPQVEGVDYFFDPNNEQVFYFRRFMPRTSIIRVTYTPKPSPGTFGNGARVVQGLDFAYTPNAKTRLDVNLAESRLDTPLGLERGFAKSATFRTELGRLNARLNWSDIPSTFVNVESTGFRRNQSGGDFSFQYDASKGFKIGLSGSKYKITTPTYTENGLQAIRGESSDIRLSTTYQPTERLRYYLEGSTFSGSYDGRPNSSQNLVAGVETRRKGLTTSLEATRQRIRAPKFGGEGLQLVTTEVTGVRLTNTYQPTPKLQLTSRIGYNTVVSDGQESSGRDLSFQASYEFSSRLRSYLTWSDSTSGAITAVGGYLGGGIGYNGNGFSGGTFGGNANLGSTRARLLQLRTEYLPTDALSLSAHFTSTMSEGANRTNSRQDSYGITANWAPSPNTSVYADISQANVSFLNLPGSSETTVMTFGASTKFAERWDASLSYSGSSFGGSGLSGFGQNTSWFDALLGYRLDPRQRLFVRYSTGNVSGYLPDRTSDLTFAYQYEIWRGVNLVASYRLRDRRSLGDLNASNSYRSSGFDLELTFDFASIRN